MSHDAVQALYDACRSAFDNGLEDEDIYKAMMQLENAARESEGLQEVRDEAEKRYGKSFGDVEEVQIDEGLTHHSGADSYWVLAWLYIPDPYDGSDPDDEEEVT